VKIANGIGKTTTLKMSARKQFVMNFARFLINERKTTMQAKIGDSIMIIGNASKDAEFKHVGEKNTPNAKWGVCIGKDQDGKAIFVNCEAWTRLAYVASEIKKGDPVMVVGKINSREYNEKTYRTLVADWVQVIGSRSQQPAQAPPPMNLDSEDGEPLPF
jgi:single-stranded DNA-binding protein